MAAKLREAAARGNTQEVLRCLEDGAKIQPDEIGRTALHLAASAGHADVAAALLLARCDVNAADKAGSTPLQRASAEGHLDVVRQLIKHGADINRQDTVHGNTALHEASWKGYSRTVQALCKARANLHLKNCGGFAALHLCCQNGHNQSCRELLLAGCNPNLQNNYGDTPLHTSARYGHAGVTRILISAKCRVSDQNKNGDTALHIAAAMGRRKLTRILLEAGCDKNLKNKQSETARDIATRKDLNEILIILTSATRGKGKTGHKGGHEKERAEKQHGEKNEKKREKNESGTSSKDSSSRQKEKKKQKHEHKVHFQKTALGKQVSPYGCHYYPDAKAFPQPNLDSLPHEPLRKGEQYYLDLAGNIRKGPVGVGYTCYCAPFFQHMEARLERDKQELKEHIDQANQRLDERVSSLERRTQGQLSELTRCVVAERARCSERHLQLAEWMTRRGPGRASERTVRDAPLPVPRARSLELLLEERGDPEAWHDVQRPGARLGRDPAVHNHSMDDLAEKGRSHPHRRSANELKSGREGAARNKHNRSFENLLEHHGGTRQDLQRRLAEELLASHRQSQAERGLDERLAEVHSGQEELEPTPEDWRGQPTRRSVHEMVARIQGRQARPEGDEGRRANTGPEGPQKWEKVSTASWARNGEAHYDLGDGSSSESSDGEDDDRLKVFQEAGVMLGVPTRNYENMVSGLPYRSRSAVYSPTQDTDQHNDSGYSTKLYGSSKGASPSLSGNLDSDGVVSSTTVYHNPKPPDPPQPRHRYLQGEDPSVTSVVTASLV
ncbi:ankyrin repeat domain-containing protein 6 [Bacillus rossius redtenbacheri]|uniref:ankyrin repeat domain-containing protein 6 n=1 Tax=Bacillus rossius redtenbacheri TaxID=93214 RepID=UPI002FDE5726